MLDPFEITVPANSDAFNYPVPAYEVLDGDTVRVTLDRGWHDYSVKSCRLYGIGAPEKKRIGGSELHKAAGVAVTAVTEQWLDAAEYVHAISIERGKYEARFIGSIINQDGEHLSVHLADLGLVKPYLGQGKVTWTDEELQLALDRATAAVPA